MRGGNSRRSDWRQRAGAVVGALILVVAAAAVVGAVPVRPVAAENAAATPVDSCTTITEPGRYELTTDLEGTDAAVCIDVRASNVAFDGNGHTIDGSLVGSAVERPGPGTRVGVGIDAGRSGQLSNVTVSNVTVTDFYHGILAETVSGGTVRNVTATGNGGGVVLDDATGVTVADSTVSENVVFGVLADSRAVASAADTRVENSTLEGNGVVGVALVSQNGSTVADNEVGGSEVGILAFRGTNLTVADNRVVDSGVVGVVLGGGALQTPGNAPEAGAPGAGDGTTTVATRGLEVRDNEILDSRWIGLYVRDVADSTFEGNDVSGTWGRSPRSVDVPAGAIVARQSSGNAFASTTARDLGDAAAYVAINGSTNRVDDLRLDTATLSFEATDVSVGPVADPPAPPAQLRALGRAVAVTPQGPDAAIDVGVRYDDADVAAAGIDEGTLALYGIPSAGGEWTELADGGVDTGGNVVSGELDGIEEPLVVAPLGEPAPVGPTPFRVTNLRAPDSAAIGETVVVRADVTNPGSATRAERIEFRFRGDVTASRRLTLDAGETRTVRFELNTSGVEPGRYIHAVFADRSGAVAFVDLRAGSFGVRDLRAPERATVGDTVTVSALVSNPNPVETTQPVTFRLFGDVVAERAVTLDAGESRRVAFEVDTDGLDPGVYVHGIFTRDEGEFGILGLEEERDGGPPGDGPPGDGGSG